MQGEITEAIKELKLARFDINGMAWTAQNREDNGRGTLKDVELIKWVEDLSFDIDEILEKLQPLESAAADFDNWTEE